MTPQNHLVPTSSPPRPDEVTNPGPTSSLVLVPPVRDEDEVGPFVDPPDEHQNHLVQGRGHGTRTTTHQEGAMAPDTQQAPTPADTATHGAHDTLAETLVPIADLTPYDRNPRRGNLASIRESLATNGQYRPIVANRRTSQVLAGNHTIAAARELGWSHIAVSWVDVDDETAARIVLVDNRTNDIAGYDDAALIELLQSLPDLDGTGYDDEALSELLGAAVDGGGSGGAGEARPTLADRFLIPPFDVLDARKGWWQERKKHWIGLGIRSELGRAAREGSERLTWSSPQIADIGFYKRKEAQKGENRPGYSRDEEKGLLLGSASGRDPTYYEQKSAAEKRLGRELTLEEFEAEHYEPSKRYEYGTSIFDPVLCELVYRWFSAPGMTVLDPFAGGSVRGLMAALLGRGYVGNDLAAAQIEENRKQAEEFAARGLIGGAAAAAPARGETGHVTDPEAATPVEQHGGHWVKRDDLFTLPGNAYAAAGGGGKIRAALKLIAAQPAPPIGLVGCGARQSPQPVRVAAVAQHLGIPARVHVPSAKTLTPELEAAAGAGAELVEHRPGYMNVIRARCRDDAKDRGWLEVPFGMDHPLAVEATAGQARLLADQLPDGVTRLVVPVGSGVTLSGIIRGLAEAGVDLPILGVRVGGDPEECLDRYVPGWRSRVELVESPLRYEQHAPTTRLGDFELDPVYEAKCLEFLQQGDLLWVVGRRPDPADREAPVGGGPIPVWSSGDSAAWVDTLEPESADLILTCPPYLWLERYSDEPGDLSNMSEDEFTAGYERIIAGAARALRDDRFAVFVVGDVRTPKGDRLVDFGGLTIRACEKAGLSLHSSAVLVTAVGSLSVRVARAFQASRVLGRTHQDVLVFLKGDRRRATQAVGDVDLGDVEALAADFDRSDSPEVE